jgi:hypothetical protein
VIGTRHVYVNELVSGFSSSQAFHIDPGHLVLAVQQMEAGGVDAAAWACWHTPDTITYVRPSSQSYEYATTTIAGQQAYAIAFSGCGDHSYEDMLYVEYEGQALGVPDEWRPLRYYRRPVYWAYYAYSDMTGDLFIGEAQDAQGRAYPVQASLGALDMDFDGDGNQEPAGWRATALMGYSQTRGPYPDYDDSDGDGDTDETIELFPLDDTRTVVRLENLPAVHSCRTTRARLNLVEIPAPMEDAPWAPCEWQDHLDSDVFDGLQGRPDGVPHNSPVLLENGTAVQWGDGACSDLPQDPAEVGILFEGDRSFRRQHAWYTVLEGFRIRSDLDSDGDVDSDDLAQFDDQVSAGGYTDVFDLDLDGDIDQADRVLLVADLTAN